MPGALGMGHLTRPAGQENVPTAAARVPRVVVARMCCFPCPYQARCPPKPHQSESWSRGPTWKPQGPPKAHPVSASPPSAHQALQQALEVGILSEPAQFAGEQPIRVSRGPGAGERERRGAPGNEETHCMGRIMGRDEPWEWGHTWEFGEPHTDGSGLGTGPAGGRRLPRVGEMHKDGWEEG